jgi:hypothetical protein
VTGAFDPSTRSHRGPFFCFERHSGYDLLADGRKIMGSAQRRTTKAVLQHGSLLLDSRFEQQQCATVAEFAPNFNIDDHLGEIAASLAPPHAHRVEGMDAGELVLADTLRDKYAGGAWLCQR